MFSYESHQINYKPYENEDCQVLKMQNVEVALERAIEDITLLHEHLGCVIKMKEQLDEEKVVRDRKMEMVVSELRKQMERKDREIGVLKCEHQQYCQLLKDTKESLDSHEQLLQQRDDEKRRYERIINDQKSTIQQLQEELLTIKYNADISIQNLTQDNMAMQELEKQVEQLQFQNRKIQNHTEKDIIKLKKAQKENLAYRQWLCKVTGVTRIVEGCEKVLMDEISSRLLNSIKF